MYHKPGGHERITITLYLLSHKILLTPDITMTEVWSEVRSAVGGNKVNACKYGVRISS